MSDLPKHTGIRTFEMVQYVTAPLEGDMDDWPANIQDVIMAAVEAKAKEVELPLVIVMSRCAEDIDTIDPQQRYFIHVILSEVVMKVEDGRKLQ